MDNNIKNNHFSIEDLDFRELTDSELHYITKEKFKSIKKSLIINFIRGLLITIVLSSIQIISIYKKHTTDYLINITLIFFSIFLLYMLIIIAVTTFKYYSIKYNSQIKILEAVLVKKYSVKGKRDILSTSSSNQAGNMVIFKCDKGNCTTAIKLNSYSSFLELEVGDNLYIEKVLDFGEAKYNAYKKQK